MSQKLPNYIFQQVSKLKIFKQTRTTTTTFQREKGYSEASIPHKELQTGSQAALSRKGSTRGHPAPRLSHEHRHMTNTLQTQQVTFRNRYAHTHICACNDNQKRHHELERQGGGDNRRARREEKEGRNILIIL